MDYFTSHIRNIVFSLDDLFLVMLSLSALASLLRAHIHSSSPGKGRGTPLRNISANQSFYINENQYN